ncbi:MAG: hypothetical protein INR70_08805 [Parafilimonas terrae]|nr:hypothetical protein [Parafilimonas terrae]
MGLRFGGSCNCCGGGTGPAIIVPPGCTCTAVPASMSLSFDATTYGAFWTGQAVSAQYTADKRYKPTGLVYYATGGPSYLPANKRFPGNWYSDAPFVSEDWYANGTPTPSKEIHTAAWMLGCGANFWTLQLVDTRAPDSNGLGANQTETLWRFSAPGEPNSCAPFLLTCGLPLNQGGNCNYAFKVQ